MGLVSKGFCLGEYMVPNRDALNGTSLVPRVWANPPYNFDHLGEAALTLFEVTYRQLSTAPLIVFKGCTAEWVGGYHA